MRSCTCALPNRFDSRLSNPSFILFFIQIWFLKGKREIEVFRILFACLLLIFIVIVCRFAYMRGSSRRHPSAQARRPPLCCCMATLAVRNKPPFSKTVGIQTHSCLLLFSEQILDFACRSCASSMMRWVAIFWRLNIAGNLHHSDCLS